MYYELYEVRRKIKYIDNEISSIRNRSRNTNIRIYEIEDIINKYRRYDSSVISYNNYLRKTEEELYEGIYTEQGRKIIDLNAIEEKESPYDSKISSAISALRTEISNLRSKITSNDNEINSLQSRKSYLREKERKLIYEIQGREY